MSEYMAIKKSILTDIGDSIRTRKDSTDLIPVKNIANEITGFPTVRIDGEKVTRDYNLQMSKLWEAASILPEVMAPTSRVIVYNGQIHLFGGATNSTYHYAWDGTTWTKIDIFNDVTGDPTIYNSELYAKGNGNIWKWDGTTKTRICMVPAYSYYSEEDGEYYGVYYGTYFVLYHGEVHLFGGHESREDTTIGHWKWDAESGNLNKYIRVSTLPFEPIYSGSWFVFNDEIHYLCLSMGLPSGRHYKWDGTAWTQLANPPITGQYTKILILEDGVHLYAPGVEGDYYGSDPKAHWLFDGTNWTQLEDLDCEIGYGRMVMYEGELHYLGVGTNGDDGTTSHQTVIETYREV